MSLTAKYRAAPPQLQQRRKVHHFRASLAREDGYAPQLDQWLSKIGKVEDAPMPMQYIGIDRILCDFCYVEYKLASRAEHYQAVFIETWSNFEGNRRGWAYTCKADWLLYFLIGIGVAVLPVVNMRRLLPEWEKNFRESSVINSRGDDTYTTKGVVVPLTALYEVEGAKLCKFPLDTDPNFLLSELDDF